MKSSKLILVLFLPLATETAFAKNFIVGGQEVNHPDPVAASTVGIFSPSGGGSGSLCTGTLIRKDIALTAAHCISSNGQKPEVIFDPDLHDPAAVRRQSSAVAVNPAWRTRAGRGMDQGDIALVKFRGGLPHGYHKAPTALNDKAIRKGARIVLAGYGISNVQTKEGAGRLREAEVPVLESRRGKSEMILDQSHGQGACHGDSGGPAYIRSKGKMVLAGLTNRSYPAYAPDDCAHQVVYTKVPAYRSWIQKSEKKLGAKQTSLRLRQPPRKRQRLQPKRKMHVR